MSKFAKGNNSINAKGNNLKKDNFCFIFHQVMYLFFSISCASLKLLAVIVFEISSFLCPNLQRAIAKLKKKKFKFNQVICSLSSIS